MWRERIGGHPYLTFVYIDCWPIDKHIKHDIAVVAKEKTKMHNARRYILLNFKINFISTTSTSYK